MELRLSKQKEERRNGMIVLNKRIYVQSTSGIILNECIRNMFINELTKTN